MDERGIYDNIGTNQNQPTTSESGTTEGGANKRDPVSAHPAMGQGIAGRDVEGGSTVSDTREEPDPAELTDRPHRAW